MSVSKARLNPRALVTSSGNTIGRKPASWKIHTLINGLLITALAVLVITRFFRFPLASGDWINSVGGPLGVGSLGSLFGPRLPRLQRSIESGTSRFQLDVAGLLDRHGSGRNDSRIA